MALQLHPSHALPRPGGLLWPSTRRISQSPVPKEPIFSITLPDKFGMRVPPKNEGTAVMTHWEAHLILGHYRCLLGRIGKNVRVADVEVVFVVCAEDWGDQSSLSCRASNLICLGHESMCRDGPTDRAGKGT